MLKNFPSVHIKDGPVIFSVSQNIKLILYLHSGEAIISKKLRVLTLPILNIEGVKDSRFTPRAILDVVVKRKILSPHQELNPRTPTVQPIAQCYTD
jgi:hypothetical protein